MERIALPLIAKAILTAPGWARAGITAPSSTVREDAAQALAQSIACLLDGEGSSSEPSGTGAGTCHVGIFTARLCLQICWTLRPSTRGTRAGTDGPALAL